MNVRLELMAVLELLAAEGAVVIAVNFLQVLLQAIIALKKKVKLIIGEIRHREREGEREREKKIQSKRE